METDGDFCNLCEGATFDNYTSWTHHISSFSHQRKSKSLVSNWKKEWMSRSVIISGIPGEKSREKYKNSALLLSRISNAEEVEEYAPRLQRAFALVRLKNKDSCNDLLQSKRLIIPPYFIETNIRRCDKISTNEWKSFTRTTKVATKQKIDEREKNCEVETSLLPTTNQHLKTQMQTVIFGSLLSDKEVAFRMEIISTLRTKLRSIYLDGDFYPYGSTITKLGSKSSRINLYVDIRGWGQKGVNFSTKQALLWFADVSRVFKSYKEPKTKRKICTSVKASKDCRIPFLEAEFSHNNKISRFHITFSNILPVKISELICLYMELDPHVRPLMSLVRHWAQEQDLISNGMFRHYTLSLIVLVFLARKNIIPSVYKLQHICYTPNKLEVGGLWNANFCTDKNEISKNMKKPEDNQPLEISVLNLAQSFFQEVGETDFQNNVLCTLNGALIPKVSFSEDQVDSLPDYLTSYKKWVAKMRDLTHSTEVVNEPMEYLFAVDTPLIIMDPFDLSSNVADGISMHIFRQFLATATKTSKVLKSILDSASINISGIFEKVTLASEDLLFEHEVKKVKYDDEEYPPFLFSTVLDNPSIEQEYETRIFICGGDFVEALESIFGNNLIFQKYADVVNRLWLCFAFEFMSKVWKSFEIDVDEEIISLDENNKRCESNLATNSAVQHIPYSVDYLLNKTAPAVYTNTITIYKCVMGNNVCKGRAKPLVLKNIADNPLNIEWEISRQLSNGLREIKKSTERGKFLALMKTHWHNLKGEQSAFPTIQLALKINSSHKRSSCRTVFELIKTRFPDLLTSFALYRFYQVVHS